MVPTDSNFDFFIGWCNRLRRVVSVSPIISFEVDGVIFFLKWNTSKKKKKLEVTKGESCKYSQSTNNIWIVVICINIVGNMYMNS